MSYSIIQQGDTVQYNIYIVECDKLKDLQALPTDWSPGSRCLVLEDSSTWILGKDRLWHKFITGGGGSGGATELSELTDVALTIPINDGDSLVYDESLLKWTNKSNDNTIDYGIVQSDSMLPINFTSTDRKMYYVIEKNYFYFWDGEQWIPKFNDLQTKTLDEPIIIAGVEYDTVEDALQEVSDIFTWQEGN